MRVLSHYVGSLACGQLSLLGCVTSVPQDSKSLTSRNSVADEQILAYSVENLLQIKVSC